MISSVNRLPNHYETLGLTPTATDEEISQAFARKMSECRWDPMGPSARICMAYETLSDRFKRTDYDRSRGLEPTRRPRLSAMTVTQQQWAPFIASVPTNALGQAASEASAMPQMTERRAPKVGSAPKGSSLVPTSLRELAKRRGSSFEAGRGRVEGPEQAKLEAQIQEMIATRLPERASSRGSEDSQLEWKRPALAIGGCLVAAGFIGAFAGLSLKNDESSLPPEQTAIVAAAVRQEKAPAKSNASHAGEPSMNSGQMVQPARAVSWTRHARSSYARSWHARSWYAHSRLGRRPVETGAAESGTASDQPTAEIASQATAKSSVPQPAAEGPSPQ